MLAAWGHLNLSKTMPTPPPKARMEKIQKTHSNYRNSGTDLTAKVWSNPAEPRGVTSTPVAPSAQLQTHPNLQWSFSVSCIAKAIKMTTMFWIFTKQNWFHFKGCLLFYHFKLLYRLSPLKKWPKNRALKFKELLWVHAFREANTEAGLKMQEMRGHVEGKGVCRCD